MITAVILAAGESRRMSAFKPLLPFGESTVLETVLANHQSAGMLTTFVVVGHNHQRIEEVVEPLGIPSILNEDYLDGMFSSAVAAVEFFDRMRPHPEGVLFALVDQPAIPNLIIRQVKDAFVLDPHRIVLPTYFGRRGHPVIFPWSIVREIPAYDGRGGLKGFRDLHANLILEVPVNEGAVLRDMDSPRDYEAELKRKKK